MKQFETDAFKVILHDNLIKELTVKKNVTMQAKDVWESRDLTVKHNPGVKYYVLFEGDDNSHVSHDARRAAASEEYFSHVAALALYSNKVLESIRGNLFLKINRPKVPTRFFDNRHKALEWLKAQAQLGHPP